MITPRDTRLHRVPDLSTLHHAIARLIVGADPLAARACAVVVPTRAAAAALRRTLEDRLLATASPPASSMGHATVVFPELVTRAELYEGLARRAAGTPDRIAAPEREVLFRRAAGDATEAGWPPPFGLRPALVGPMLDFYDGLRRQHRTLEAFERLFTEELEPGADTDRGAARLLQQTRFLAAAYRAYQRRLEATGLLDEHELRRWLLGATFADPLRHLVVTVADQAADAGGLWPADYDLISRVPALDRIDVVATEGLLATGLLERLHDALPGIEEGRWQAEHRAAPRLVVPDQPDQPDQKEATVCFVSRDRERELERLSRMIKADARVLAWSEPEGTPSVRALHRRVGVVFQRPLPYLYLAHRVFEGAGVPFEAFDALPLAAEPFAAVVDQVLDAASSGLAREPICAVLASPHLVFRTEAGFELTRDAVAGLDRALREVRFSGGLDRLRGLEALWEADPNRRPASEALRIALRCAEELEPLLTGAAPSVQLATVAGFLRDHERPVPADDETARRHRRARAAVLAALEALIAAHLRHDDEPRPVPDVVADVRRWIENATFAPRTGSGGVQLIDAASARYLTIDDLYLVGLIEGEWPPPIQRSVFYPMFLLSQVGWPKDALRTAAARAAFADLLHLPAERVMVSSIALEDEAIVAPSSLLEDLVESGLETEVCQEPAVDVFPHEALLHKGCDEGAIGPEARAWLAVRRARSPARDPRFHGAVGPREPRAYAVGALERYLECPFRYFAASVLRLPEEERDEQTLAVLERGSFVHEVFRDFFEKWDAGGTQSVTPETLDDARRVFAEVTERLLLTLPELDRPIERAHLLGSAVATGFGERVLRAEAERPFVSVRRLLEHAVDGPVTLRREDDTRVIRIRGTADRLDLGADGTLHVLDYKLGLAPKVTRALQVPLYGIAAEQQLERAGAGKWRLASGGYFAFRSKQGYVPVITFDDRGRAVVAEAQARALDAVDGIERGAFPPRPDDRSRCESCPYPTVCRKDYVADE